MLDQPSDGLMSRATLFRRLDRPQRQPSAGAYYGRDILACSVGLIAVVEHLRARASYSMCPLFALVLPALFCLFSKGYRRRTQDWVRGVWAKVEAYSIGLGPTPWLAALVFAVAPAWIINLSNQRTLGAIDTRPVVPTAISLLTEGNWELSEYFETGQRKVSLLGRDGQIPPCFLVRPNGIHSAYPAGMVPFAVTVAGLSTLLDANLDNIEAHRHLEKMTAALVESLSIGLFFLIALRLAPPPAAWVSSAILAVASGMFTTVGMGLWQHGGIIFWSLVNLLVEFRRPTQPTRWDSLIQGFACAQLITCRLTSIAFLIPFGVWVLLRSPRRAIGIVSLAGLAYSPWALAYWRTYGNFFGPSTGFLAGRLWSSDIGEPLLGVLFSPGRGLLTYQPWILMVLALAIPSVRSRFTESGGTNGPTGWAAFCGAAIAFQVLLISAWGCWWGGWCWGSRLVVDIVPLCALLCVQPIDALWRTRRGRLLVVSLAILGLMVHVPSVYFDAAGWNATARFPEDTWSWSRPPFLDWRPGP